MATKKTAKRYTEEEKKEILDFIETYNKENGRGGQTAAIAKYKTSAISIGNWKKGPGKKAKAAGKAPKAAKKKFRNPAKLIDRLHEVTKEISKAEMLLKKLTSEAKELRKEIRSAIDS
jgi:DNA primase catalytic subunit